MKIIEQNPFMFGVAGVILLWIFYMVSRWYSATRKTQAANNAQNVGNTQTTQSQTDDQEVQTTTAPGFDWFLFSISSIGGALICVMIAYYKPELWDKLFLSVAFWLTIASLTLAIILRARGYKENVWYWVLLLVIPVTAILFELNTYTGQSSESGANTKIEQPYVEFKNGTSTHLLPYEQFRIRPEKNAEFLVIGTMNDEPGGKLVQHIAFDEYEVMTTWFEPATSNGKFKPSETITFERVKGYDPIWVKRFFE